MKFINRKNFKQEITYMDSNETKSKFITNKRRGRPKKIEISSLIL